MTSKSSSAMTYDFKVMSHRHSHRRLSHFLQKRPTISGPFAERDLQFKVSYVWLRHTCDCGDDSWRWGILIVGLFCGKWPTKLIMGLFCGKWPTKWQMTCEDEASYASSRLETCFRHASHIYNTYMIHTWYIHQMRWLWGGYDERLLQITGLFCKRAL